MTTQKAAAPDVRGANYAYIEAMLGKRMSSAAGPHADKREKRARTRSAQKIKALQDQE